MRPLYLIVAFLALSRPVWADDPIRWADPSYTDLEKIDGEPLRSPWDDIRDILEVGPRAWEKKDDAARQDLLRRAYRLYVTDLANLQSSGQADRRIYENVTAEKVKQVKIILGQDSANALAAVRSRLVARRFDRDGVLVAQGLEWLDTFDPPEGARVRRQIAQMNKPDPKDQEAFKRAEGALGAAGRVGRALKNPADFHHGVDGSVERDDIPVAVQGRSADGEGAPRRAKAGEERFSGENPSARVGLRTSNVPISMERAKTPQKSLSQIDEDRRGGMATMALGVMVAGVGAFICTIPPAGPWVGGAMVASGAAMVYKGYQTYDENTLTDAQTRQLEAQQERNRKKWGF